MIVRSVVCPLTPTAWGTFLSGAQVKDLLALVHGQLALARGTLDGHVHYVWEVLENSGLTDPAGGIRRLWDPFSAIPARTVQLTVVGIWRPSQETALTGQLAEGAVRRRGWDE